MLSKLFVECPHYTLPNSAQSQPQTQLHRPASSSAPQHPEIQTIWFSRNCHKIPYDIKIKKSFLPWNPEVWASSCRWKLLEASPALSRHSGCKKEDPGPEIDCKIVNLPKKGYLETQQRRSWTTCDKLKQRPLLFFIKARHDLPEGGDGWMVDLVPSWVVSVSLQVCHTDLMLCPRYQGGQLSAAEHSQPVQPNHIRQPGPGEKWKLSTKSLFIFNNILPESIALLLDLLV